MHLLRTVRSAGLLTVLAAAPLAAQEPEHETLRPRARAARLTGEIRLDGTLDEAAWAAATPATDFRQQRPTEGAPAQRTEVRFLFDDDALYVGARMYDDLGAAGVRTRLARRDQSAESDDIELIFDTFHDHNGRTVFSINPSGVKVDAGQAASYADPSWDPVWEAATAIDSLGWTAELRIPLSQLRFPRADRQTWGLQIWRYTERLNEVSMWSFWGLEESGGPQKFGHLEGLELRQRGLGVELLPYAVARAEFVTPVDAASPFADDADFGWRFGGDVKALLTSTLTLDATFNPDFGQVEVDPAVVNLSAFETFFPEKRPFFVEGSGLFGFGAFSCFFCSNVQSMSLFYSRRIGRAPQGFVTGDAAYVLRPQNTTILGAAKVTGRTAGGLQVGLMNALTAPEEAEAVTAAGTPFEQEIEPLTNYFVGRVRRNLRGGNATIGAIGTSVVRRFDNEQLRMLLPRHAEAVGADWRLSWNEQRWNLIGNLALSQVDGDSAAILNLQRAPARYFHRPDRGTRENGFLTDGYEPGLRTLRGVGGYARVAKEAGSWLGETAVNFRSPGFEVNDLAFLTRADYVWTNSNLFRTWTRPTRWYRRVDLGAGFQHQWNFDGDMTEQQFHGFVGTEMPNYWYANTFVMIRPESYDDRLTRGGPVVRRPALSVLAGSLNTDSRKAVSLGLNSEIVSTAEGAFSYIAGTSIRFKPAPNISASISPTFHHSESTAQFVRRFEDPAATHFFGQRVVFAELVQNTLSFDTRLSATFTPTLTLELYAQPFASAGEYDAFKEFDRPRSLEKTEFDSQQLQAETDPSGRVTGYLLDADRNPATPQFAFANPDFNFRSLRGNAVLRWEYRPGSTIFLVWQQQRSSAEPFGDFDFSRDAGAIFRERPDNIFLVKMTWWFGR